MRRTPRNNPRALDPDEVARIRVRLEELYEEYGRSDSKMAAALGFSQQGAGRVRNNLQTPGLHTAKSIARHDRVPYEILLRGVPASLYKALVAHPARWSPPAVHMVSMLPPRLPGSRKYDVAEWVAVLDRTDKIIDEHFGR